MADKQQVVKIVFQGDTNLVKRAQNEIRRENRVTQDQIRQDQSKTIKNLFDQTNKIKGHFSSLSNKTLGVLGLGLGLHGLVSSAGQFIGQIGRVGDELTGLSDQFGSVNKAVSIYYSGLGSSFASMGQVKSAMMELANEGIKLDDNFKALTFQVADFSQITGVSSSAVAGLAGTIKGFGLANKKDMRELLNSVVSIGLTGHQATLVVQTIAKAVDNLSYFAKDGGKSIKALGKGVSETTSFLTKMGVRTQTAVTFMDKLTDPEQYEEMAGLLNRINISQADYFNMLKSESGKDDYFKKLQQNLPAIADQVMAINNPIAQRNFAKSLGLPMEIAAKLAGKTRGEIQDIIGKSMTDKKALEKKESQGKANQERFTEALEMFKMQALMPLMKFMVANIPNFMKFVSLISKFVSGALQAATGYMGKFQSTVDKVFKNSNSLGELLQNAIGPIFDAIGTVIGDAFATFFNPANWIKIFSGLWSAFMKLPLWAQLLGGFLIFKRVGGFMSGLVNGFQRGLTPGNAMWTRDATVSGASGKGAANRGKRNILTRSARNSQAARIRSARGAMRGGSFGGARKSNAIARNIGKGGKMARLGSVLGKGAGLLETFGGAVAGLASPVGLAVAGIAAAGYGLYKVWDTYDKLQQGTKDHLKSLVDQGKMEEAYLTFTGNFWGTQKALLSGLNVVEAAEQGRLESLQKQGKLLPAQVKRLDELNGKMEKSTTNMTDITASVFAKIGGLFSTDNLMVAKIALALNNFGTWLGSNINDMIIGIKKSIPGFGLLYGAQAADVSVMQAFTTKLNTEISKASNGQGSSAALYNLMKEAEAQAKLGGNMERTEFFQNKAGELKARAYSMREYEERARLMKAKEDAQRHQETQRSLAGIGAGVNKTAENTAPEKNPIREAFKEIALTNTQIMETQYAGSNFSNK